MEVRPAGKVTELRAEQQAKAYSPMEVRPAGKVMSTREEQPQKAPRPMETRLHGQATGRRREREVGAVAERLVPRQVRHAFGQHRVRDDDLPAGHVQSLEQERRREWRRRSK